MWGASIFPETLGCRAVGGAFKHRNYCLFWGDCSLSLLQSLLGHREDTARPDPWRVGTRIETGPGYKWTPIRVLPTISHELRGRRGGCLWTVGTHLGCPMSRLFRPAALGPCISLARSPLGVQGEGLWM